MLVSLYSTTDELNTINKTLTKVADVNGIFKNNTSLNTVRIRLQYKQNNFNYVYIPKFNRYYFVTNTEIESTDIIVLTLKCDVLMSYQAEIFNTEAIIKRNTNLYNTYIQDRNITLYSNEYNFTLPFSKGFNGYGYALITAGG